MSTNLKADVTELGSLMDSSNPNLDRCKELVKNLKIALVKLPMMSPGAVLDESDADSLLLAREVYERAAGLSILCEDIPSFYRNVALLKDFYFDYARLLPQSKSQNLVIGLHLLLLLAENRIAEFHSELEIVPEQSRNDPFVSFPVKLEQFLTEGSYTKLIASEQHVPDPSFVFFMKLLMETVRNEVARSSESAYSDLPYADAIRMLNFETVAELETYASDRGWTFDGELIKFGPIEEPSKEDSTVEEGVFEMIRRSLHYAIELERIV